MVRSTHANEPHEWHMLFTSHRKLSAGVSVGNITIVSIPSKASMDNNLKHRFNNICQECSLC